MPLRRRKKVFTLRMGISTRSFYTKTSPLNWYTSFTFSTALTPIFSFGLLYVALTKRKRFEFFRDHHLTRFHVGRVMIEWG